MRGYGRFTTSIWRDPDFTSLNQPLQAVYFMLCTQPGVTAAGTLALTPGRWAKLSTGASRREVEEQLVALQAHAGRHVVIDEDTEELIIRTFIKWDDGWKNSKRLPVIFDAIRAIGSVHIRDIAVDELRKIATGIPQTYAERQARDTVSRQLDSYLETIRDTPGALSPLPLALDLHPKPQPGAVAADDVGSPPSMFCDEHPNGTTGPCGGCARAREVFAAAAQSKLAGEVASKQARREAIDACGLCDEHGKRTDSSGRILARVCDHVVSGESVTA